MKLSRKISPLGQLSGDNVRLHVGNTRLNESTLAEDVRICKGTTQEFVDLFGGHPWR